MNQGSDDQKLAQRDRVRAIERLRAVNQSPWSIGVSHWNQRDLYTRNSSIDDDGYGRGPARHPEEGSYAYPREWTHQHVDPNKNGATRSEREAWPLLNYTSAHDDPYFAQLDHGSARPSFWTRLKGGVAELLHYGQAPRPPENLALSDLRVKEDVSEALRFRNDLDATDIDVTVHAGKVTLEGTVTDRRSKRIAEETSEGVLGVREVHNRLTIRKDDPTDANVAFVLPLGTLG